MSTTIIFTVASLSVLGLLLAVVLYFVAQKFKVEEDPRIDIVEAIMPGANCGGCGQAGCRAFAEACTKADNLDSLFCPVGGNATMKKVADALGFEVAESLATPEVNTEFAGEILPSQGAEIYLRHDLALAPVKAYTWKDVENVKENEYGKVVIAKEFAQGEPMVVQAGETLVIDFGQNMTGYFEIDLCAKRGDRVSFSVAEVLDKDGNFYNENYPNSYHTHSLEEVLNKAYREPKAFYLTEDDKK